MSILDWVALMVGGIAIASAAITVTKWIIKNEVRDIKVETTANGGSSMNDKIKLEIVPLLNEIRKEQIEIGKKVANLDGRFEEHVKGHK